MNISNYESISPVDRLLIDEIIEYLKIFPYDGRKSIRIGLMSCILDVMNKLVQGDAVLTNITTDGFLLIGLQDEEYLTAISSNSSDGAFQMMVLPKNLSTVDSLKTGSALALDVIGESVEEFRVSEVLAEAYLATVGGAFNETLM